MISSSVHALSSDREIHPLCPIENSDMALVVRQVRVLRVLRLISIIQELRYFIISC